MLFGGYFDDISYQLRSVYCYLQNKKTKINNILYSMLCVILYVICFVCQISCSIYKVDLRQGIEINEDQLAKLTLKLNKKQVQQILGETSLQPINTNRLDYYYLNKTKNHNIVTKKTLTLYFNNQGELLYYDGDIQLKNLPRKIKK